MKTVLKGVLGLVTLAFMAIVGIPLFVLLDVKGAATMLVNTGQATIDELTKLIERK